MTIEKLPEGVATVIILGHKPRAGPTHFRKPLPSRMSAFCVHTALPRHSFSQGMASTTIEAAPSILR